MIREGKVSMINAMIQTGSSLGIQAMDQIDKENFKKQMAPTPASAMVPPGR